MKIIDGRDEANLHFRWFPEVKPIVKIDPDELIEVIVPDSSTMQIRRESEIHDLGTIDSSKFDAAVGAIEISGTKKVISWR